MENVSMEVRQNGDQAMSPSPTADDKCVAREIGDAGASPHLVPCVVTDGLSVGMEVCTYDNPGMGLECDEDILTTSSLECSHSKLGAAEREGERGEEGERGGDGVRRGEVTSELRSRDDVRDNINPGLTNSAKPSHISLPGHPKFCKSVDESSALDNMSQSSQSDETYSVSQLSSSQREMSDVVYTSFDDGGTITNSDREEVGVACKVGGACSVHPEGGRRRVGRGRRERRGRNVERGARKGVRKGNVNGLQTQTSRSKVERVGRRRPELERLRAESSDSSETMAEDDSSIKSFRKRSGKRSPLLLPPKSSRTLPPKRTKFPHEPPANILGAILTDIPEVDIRPQALPKIANHIHKEAERREEREGEGEGEEGGEDADREASRIVKKRSGKNGGRGNGTKRENTMSNHYRILMSWERDYPLGLHATRAPVLYALDNIPEKVKAVKGGWINRAKLIWTTWRRANVAKRDKYCERAKSNRLKQKGRTGARAQRNNSKREPKKSPRSGTNCSKTRPNGTTAVAPPSPQIKTKQTTSAKSPDSGTNTRPNPTTTPPSPHPRAKRTKRVEKKTKREPTPANHSPTTPKSASRETSGSVGVSTADVASPLSLHPPPSSLSSPMGLQFYCSPGLSIPHPSSPYLTGVHASLLSPLSSPFGALLPSDRPLVPTPVAKSNTTTISPTTLSSLGNTPSSSQRSTSCKRRRRASISAIPCSEETRAREQALRAERLTLTSSSSSTCDGRKNETAFSATTVASSELLVHSITSSLANSIPISSCPDTSTVGLSSFVTTSLCSQWSTSLSNQPLTLPLNSDLIRHLATPTSLNGHDHPSTKFPSLPPITSCIVTTSPVSHVSPVSQGTSTPSLSHSHTPSKFSSKEKQRSNSMSSTRSKKHKSSWSHRSRSHSSVSEGVACPKPSRRPKSSTSLPSSSPSLTHSSITSSSSKYLTNLKPREISPELLPYLVPNSLSSIFSPATCNTPLSLHAQHMPSAVLPSGGVPSSPSLSVSHLTRNGSQLHTSTTSLSPMVAHSSQLTSFITSQFAGSGSLHSAISPSQFCSVLTSNGSHAATNTPDDATTISYCSTAVSNGTTNTITAPRSASSTNTKPNCANTIHFSDHDVESDGKIFSSEAEKLMVEKPRLLSKLTQFPGGDGFNIYKQKNTNVSGYVATDTAKLGGRGRVTDRERAKKRGATNSRSHGNRNKQRSRERRPVTDTGKISLPSTSSSLGEGVRVPLTADFYQNLGNGGKFGVDPPNMATNCSNFPPNFNPLSTAPANSYSSTTSHATRSNEKVASVGKSSNGNSPRSKRERSSSLSSLPTPQRSYRIPTSLAGEEGAALGHGSIIPPGLESLIPRLPTNLLLGRGPSNNGGSTVTARRRDDSYEQKIHLLSDGGSPLTPTTSGSSNFTRWVGTLPPGVYSTPPLCSTTSHTPSRPLPSSSAPLNMLTPLPPGSNQDNAMLGIKVKKEVTSSTHHQLLQPSCLPLSFSQTSSSQTATSVQMMTSFNTRVEKSSSSVTATGSAEVKSLATDKKSKTPTDKVKKSSPRLPPNTKKKSPRGKTKKSDRPGEQGTVGSEAGKKSLVGGAHTFSVACTEPGQHSNGFVVRPSLPHPLTMFSLSPSSPHTSVPQTAIPHNSIPPFSPFGMLGNSQLGQPVFSPSQPNTPFDHPGINPGQPLQIPGLPGILSGHHTPHHPSHKPMTTPFSLNLQLWELEQLYLHSLAILEQQKHYTKYLETEIQRMRESPCQQTDHLGNQLSSEQQQTYRHFLRCVVEPEFETHVPLFLSGGSSSPSETQTVVFRESHSDDDIPSLLPEFDFYGNFLKQCRARADTPPTVT